jgi:3-hydroxyisobutyrate dehydrogenase-like beta-hydroxyacid dehydrogenase
MSDAKRIGWIGAGKMGFPISVRFKNAGHAVTVLARNAAAEEKLVATGLIAAQSVTEVAQQSEIVFSSLSDDAAFCQVAAELCGAMREASTFIDISTVSPSISVEVAENFKKHNINYLRSPVSGSTAMAEAGTLTAVISGPKQAYDDLAPIFSVFAKKTFHVGEGEEARVMKLVLNSIVAATSALLGEALAFGESGGLDNATMLSVINQSAVASQLIGYKTEMIVKGDYTAAASLAMLKKDLELLIAAAPHTLPLSAHIHQIYQNAAARGFGEEDFFVLVREAKLAEAKS